MSRLFILPNNYIRKIKIDDFIYIVSCFFFLFSVLVSKSLFAYKYNLSFLRYCIYICESILFLFFLYSNRKLNKKRFFQIALLLCVGIITWLRVDAKLLNIFMLALTNKRNYRKVINVFFYALSCSTLVILFCDMLGIIPQYYLYRSDGARRYTLGFNHPNTLAFVVVALLLLLILKRNGALTLWDHFFVVRCALICYIIPNSLTAAIIILFIELLIIIQLLYKCIYKGTIISNPFYRQILMLLIPFTIVFIYYIILNLDKTFSFDFNNTLWSRILQSRNALEYYGFSIWGQKVELTSSTAIYFGSSSLYSTFFALDCLYIYLPVRYGIIPSLYFLYQFINCIRLYIKQKNVVALTICIALIVYSGLETALFDIMMSFVFICAYANEGATNYTNTTIQPCKIKSI